MPIYVVRRKSGDDDPITRRLVKADNAAQAMRHVAQDTLALSVATTEEAVELGAAGVKVETAA